MRLYVARPTLATPKPGYKYPDWAINTLSGIRETIHPMIDCAAKTPGLTIVDLLTDAALLAEAQREFKERTGGDNYIAPLCDYLPPVGFNWPEYVTDGLGQRRWSIPALPWE